MYLHQKVRGRLFSFSILGYGLRVTYNSDIFEKLRPPMGFQMSEFEFQTFLCSPPPLFATLSQRRQRLKGKVLIIIHILVTFHDSWIKETRWGRKESLKKRIYSAFEIIIASLAAPGSLAHCLQHCKDQCTPNTKMAVMVWAL